MGIWVVCHQRCMGGSCGRRGPLRRVSVWLVVPMTHKPLILGLSAALLVSQWMLWDALWELKRHTDAKDWPKYPISNCVLGPGDVFKCDGPGDYIPPANLPAKTILRDLRRCVSPDKEDRDQCWLPIEVPMICNVNQEFKLARQHRKFICTETNIWAEVK